MPRKTLYERNYEQLQAIVREPLERLRCDVAYHLKASGFMDLVIEVLSPPTEPEGMVISLAHYYEQFGDLCADPEMTVRVHRPAAGRASIEALTFQQASPPIYHQVYPEPGKVDRKRKRELNTFLAQWLRNLKAQGHRLSEGEGEEALS